MADFINSLAVSFNVPGLAPRAITLFNQVRNVSNFRWGNKARSIAAACLAIALRQSNRPDALRDIASVLDISPTSVSREFTHITTTLGLSLSLTDSSVYMPTLQAHLSASLTDRRLPSSLSKDLQKLNLLSVNETAVSLSRLLTRLSPGHDVLRLPVPPTACAIFILALEGDLRGPLNPMGEMANCLGARFQVAKSVVMTRYKTVQDEVASWLENLPWLDKYQTKGGRGKVARRLIVARGLKDVIGFQEDIWRQRSNPAFSCELSTDDESEEVQGTKAAHPRPKVVSKPNRSMAQSIQFLLDPLGTPVPHLPPVSSRGPFSVSQLSLATYLLTSPSASVTGRPPTRLQLLACLRGGSSEDKITDDELFTESELENLFRDENEIGVLREAFGWNEDDLIEDPNNLDKGSNRKRKRTKPVEDLADSQDGIVTGSAFRPRKTRLNMEALAQFMSGSHGDSEQFMGLEDAIDDVDLGNMDEDDCGSEEISLLPKRRRHTTSPLSMTQPAVEYEAEGVVLDQWRASSPGVTYDDSRYEEEYD